METTPTRITIKHTEMPYNNTQSKKSNNTTSTLTPATPTPTNNSSKPTINLDMSPDNTYGKTLIRKCSANSRPQTSNSSLTQNPVEEYNEEYEDQDYPKDLTEKTTSSGLEEINTHQQRTSSIPTLNVPPHIFTAHNKIENNNMIHNEYTLSKADQERAIDIIEDNRANIICSNKATKNENGIHCIGQYIGREFVYNQNLRFLEENLAADPSIANYDVEANFEKGKQDLNKIINSLETEEENQNSSINELNNKKEELNNKKEELNTEKQNIETEIKKYNEKMKKTQEQIEECKNQLKTLATKRTNLLDKIDQLKTDIGVINQNITKFTGKIKQYENAKNYYTNLHSKYKNTLEDYKKEEEKESLETKKKYFIQNCKYIVTKNKTSLSSNWEHEVDTLVLKELDTILPDGHPYKNNLSSELTTHRSTVILQEGLTKTSEKLRDYFNALADNPEIPNGFKIFIDTRHSTINVVTPDNIEIGLKPNQLKDETIQWSLITCINDRTMVRDQDNDETVRNLDCNPFYTGNGPNPKAADIYKQLFEQNTVTSKASKKRRKCKD